MRGHWESQTRKLNRHYQSAGTNWTNKGYGIIAPYYQSAPFRFKELYESGGPGWYPRDTSKYLALPTDNKIKVLCYSDFENVVDDTKLFVGFIDPATYTRQIARVWFYNANKQNITNNPFPISPDNTTHNMISKTNVYRNRGATTPDLRNALVISKSKNSPTFYEVDLTSILTNPTYIVSGETPVYYRVDFSVSAPGSTAMIYVFSEDINNPGITTNTAIANIYLRTVPQNVR